MLLIGPAFFWKQDSDNSFFYMLFCCQDSDKVMHDMLVYASHDCQTVLEFKCFHYLSLSNYLLCSMLRYVCLCVLSSVEMSR